MGMSWVSGRWLRCSCLSSCLSIRSIPELLLCESQNTTMDMSRSTNRPFFSGCSQLQRHSDGMNASNHTHLIMVSPQNHSVLRFGPLYLTSWQLSPAMPGSSNMKLEAVHCLAPWCQHSFCILNCFWKVYSRNDHCRNHFCWTRYEQLLPKYE